MVDTELPLKREENGAILKCWYDSSMEKYKTSVGRAETLDRDTLYDGYDSEVAITVFYEFLEKNSLGEYPEWEHWNRDEFDLDIF